MNDNPLDLQATVSPAPVAVAVPGESDCIVHNLETGQTYRLNDVGARIWELLEQGHPVAAIRAQLCNEYRLPEGISSKQIEHDVTTILTQLHEYGLLTVG
jgi:hypothetical protein